MGIDQSGFGQHVQEMMQQIEQDPEIPGNAQINTIVTIVEVVGGDEENQFSHIRVNSNATPYVALGILEVAKSMQMKMMGA